MDIKAVIFDFDDTLGFRERYTYLTYCQKLDEVCPGLDPWKREMYLQYLMVIDQHGEVERTYIRDRFLDKLGIDLGEDFQEYWHTRQCDNVVLYDDAMETVLELKKRGYLIGILTNGSSYGQRSKVVNSGLIDCIDGLLISGETNCQKPDPEIFRQIAAQMNVKPEECAYVGDMFRNDMYGAHEAGMRPIWCWPHGYRDVSVDITRIRCLKDLLDLFPGVKE